jgi:CBS domain-containing protein
MKPIKDIMTPLPHSCGKDETMLSIANLMLKHNIGALPVVDEKKKVIGIITDRDIIRAIFRSAKACAVNTCFINEIKVYEAMTTEVYTINIDEDAANALNLMREKKVGRLPIIDHEERLMGIISFNSISRKMYKEDIEKAGKDNIINSIQSIKDRNENIVNE